MSIKTMTVKEFVETGYLQELNRLFLHPRGLALAVTTDELQGVYHFAEIWDAREDPEGWMFGDLDIEVAQEKATNVEKEFKKHLTVRNALLKTKKGIQPIKNESKSRST